MPEHKLTQTNTLKTNLVCFACDIPNLYPEHLRESRRQIQFAVLARQQKEKEEAAENGTTLGNQNC